MCGIAGWSFGPNFNPPSPFRQVLISWLAPYMDERGGDSYGYAKLDKRGRVKVWKQTGKAAGQLRLKDVTDTPLLMFHARKKTHGDVCIENAHPIQQHHLLGCHNGVVHNHDELNKDYGRDFVLDSRHIFEHLALGLPVRELRVYGAISFIDLNNPATLNLCRLSATGDLEVVGIGSSKDDVQGIVYASTFTPINKALTMLGCTFFRYNIPVGVKHYVKDGALWLDSNVDYRFGQFQYSKGGTSAKKEPLVFPAGFTPCKACKKKWKKKQIHYSSDLCTTCWRAFPIGGTTITRYCCKPYCNKVKEMSRTEGNVERHFCIEHYREEYKKTISVKEAEGVDNVVPFPTGTAGTKEIGGSGVEGELESRIDRPDRLPFEPDAFDLCAWCTLELRRKAVDNKGRLKFSISDLCGGCEGKWQGLLKDFKVMTSGERCMYAPVLSCGTCGVPVFGRKRVPKEELSKVQCVDCAGLCRRCGESMKRDGRSEFSAVRGGLVQVCQTCRAEKFARVGEEVRNSPYVIH